MLLRKREAEGSALAKVIFLKERNFKMLKKELILKNPLRLMGHDSDDILFDGGFGVVMARAGVGKTAIGVQLAINSQLRRQNVLHIALKDPVQKVCLWYDQVLRNLINQYEVSQEEKIWETILPHRFIMTFKVESFSVPILEERLNDLIEQGIFVPKMVLIDGFPFEDEERTALEDLKSLANELGFHTWFTMTTHRHLDRHLEPGPDGLPPIFSKIEDLYEVAIQLIPEGKQINVKALKGLPEKSSIRLNPSTMLLTE
jgi:hypothetical protein